VDEIKFAKGASAYFFNFDFPVRKNTPALKITGQGVSNESTNHQNFVVASTAVGYDYPQLMFTNKASAGGPNMFYSVGPATLEGSGGGVIIFVKESTAGSANFNVTTGAGTPPRYNSTVGGEVSFGDNASASTATFTISGSTSLTDGDTFGNVVFHNSATAANAKFMNIGGTVPGGDGGNTQFYDNSNAAEGVFNNLGGTAYGVLYVQNPGKKVQEKQQGANGGDVAFDGSATGGHGEFHNYAGKVAGANGGVTSFNNNPPNVTPFATPGANAGDGCYNNYGADESNLGGGGHTYFTAKHGSPLARHGTFNNYGSTIKKSSSAGHTVFSITDGTDGTSVSYGDAKPSGKPGSVYYPTADHGTFNNYPAKSASGAPGYTEFAVYQPYNADGSRDSRSGTSDSNKDNVPTAGSATFHNNGGTDSEVSGGYTVFKDTTNADKAKLIAFGGTNGGYGGRIVFYDSASGGTASVQLSGNSKVATENGTLDIAYYVQPTLKIGSLEMDGGTIETSLGTDNTRLEVAGNLTLKGTPATATFKFSYKKKYDSKYDENDDTSFELDKTYTILTAPNLSSFNEDQFRGNSLDEVEPTFTFDGNNLQVSFKK
jgi:hypothetical protein